MTLDECEQHFAAIRASVAEDEVQTHLRILLDTYPVMSFELGRGSVFWRGRKTGIEPYANISHMSYPPSELAALGRLNNPGQPCLYAATRRSTVLTELGVVEGDYIQLIGFRVKPHHKLRVVAIGELFHVYKTGYTKSLGTDPGNALSRTLNAAGLDRGTKVVYVDAFLGNLLSDRNARDSSYVATRLLASLAYQKSGADGLFYPSVQDHVGMNVALLPGQYDSATHPVCCQFVRITKVRDFGFFDSEILLEATNIGNAGEIEWAVPKAQNVTTFVGLTKREHDFITTKARPDGNAFLDLVNLHQNER